ncbi:MAG: 16S rRNA (adenine(1518)-N(6)/adenine(1519)-N(6))-dimethyltransferase RsmA [Gemmatimonadota bacterium]|nr:16S rRNA (adenine(1518)-N(6)/adenine(1519)-N(6))-dimethyltransferase RsmA [Gemmatimonadota bacterium]
MGRRLGQHFLFDPGILDRIVDAIDPELEDVVIEVGPGKGTLTKRLAPRVGAVVAIERDVRLANDLEREHISGVRVVAGDALDFDWPLAVPKEKLKDHFKVVGNIPYKITTPLIEKALTPPLPVNIVFLLQKEVGDRLQAAPGSSQYGGLTVGVNAVARVERLFSVKAGSFSPPPRVDSVVVKIVPLDSPLVSLEDRPDFRRFVTQVFSKRRKQMERCLRSALDISREEAGEILQKADVDPGVRPEVLLPQDFVRLFRSLPR